MNTIKRKNLIASLAFVTAASAVSTGAYAGGMSDPMLTMFSVDRLEQQFIADEPNATLLEGTAWIGHDLKKFWLNYEVHASDNSVEDAELEWLYHKGISPFWNLQVGIRQQIKPDPVDYGFMAGFEGTAPYFVEVQTHLSWSETGIIRWNFRAEKEWMLTQQWVLISEISGNAYNETNPEKETGSGLSDTEVSFRLQYAIKPDLAPYIGVNWNNLWGNRKDLAKQEGESSNDYSYSIGIQFWF